MTLYLDDGDVRLYHGHTLDALRGMPVASVDCIVTSPPYYGLRDYGTGEWTGGDPDCDHVQVMGGARNAGRDRAASGGTFHDAKDPQPALAIPYRDVCGRCGARRVDHQIGLEATPAEYLAILVDVFRECRRVLADHGTCWVNLGDSYNGTGGAKSACSLNNEQGGLSFRGGHVPTRIADLPAKNLLGMPWRLALALQDDGWILRRDIIWAKPNPMPESVTDRCTSAHEYVFQLVKSNQALYWTHEDGRIAGPAKPPQEYRVEPDGRRVPLWTGHDYWYDADAVREPLQESTLERGYTASKLRSGVGAKTQANPDRNNGSEPWTVPVGRNLRSVWEIATQPTPEAHFATYPEELVRRCILAGCPLEVCRECGKPRERIVEREKHGDWGRKSDFVADQRDGLRGGHFYAGWKPPTTLGWSDCGHNAYRRGVVLDPFAGSGTTSKVARDHGRHSIGIDLNAAYLEIAAKRLQQLSLLSEAT